MKYLLLIYDEEKNFETMTEAETRQLVGEYAQFTQEIQASGHYKTSARLQPTPAATSIRIRDGKRMVTDGPFAETKELVAGYWLWEVKSKQEAVDWAKRCPNPTGADGVLELRQIFEPEDFGAELTPELREKEENLRKQSGEKR